MSTSRFIFVHGAGLGAWVWDDVRARLRPPSVAVDLPLRDDPRKLRKLRLDDYVVPVTDAIDASGGDKVVLVGHSVGGEIVLRAATLRPERIEGIVFISATIPPPGRSMLSLQPWLRRLFMRFIYRLLTPKPPENVIRAGGCNDLDEATCQRMLDQYVTESPKLFLDPADWKLPASVPRWYVKTMKDMTLNPLVQDLMLDRVKPVTVEQIEAGHLSMLARPEELAGILNGIAIELQEMTELREAPNA